MMAVTDEGRTARRPARPERGGGALGQDPEDPILRQGQVHLPQGEFDPLGQPCGDPPIGPDARPVTDWSRRCHDGMRKSHLDHHTVRASNYNSREFHSGSSCRRKRAQRCSSSTSPMAAAAVSSGVEGAQESPIRLMAPADIARTPPPGGPQGVEPAVIADPGEGVSIDGHLGQFRQGGPRLKATGVGSRHGRDRGPALGRREGDRGTKCLVQFRADRVQHRLGASAGELDGVFGGHDVMLGTRLSRAVETSATPLLTALDVVGVVGGDTLRPLWKPSRRPQSNVIPDWGGGPSRRRPWPTSCGVSSACR